MDRYTSVFLTPKMAENDRIFYWKIANPQWFFDFSQKNGGGRGGGVKITIEYRPTKSLKNRKMFHMIGAIWEEENTVENQILQNLVITP